MRIIALRGSDSCGKTTTLNLVYNMLVVPSLGTSTCKAQEGGDKLDFSDVIINYKEKRIAFFTMGDFSICTIHAIIRYNSLNIDVLVLATNDKFVKPINLIMNYTPNLIPKTKALNPSLEVAANQTDAQTIFNLI
ncbi:MAG: hypothetical protein ACYDCN_15465 [Bacteroidia bacterium]